MADYWMDRKSMAEEAYKIIYWEMAGSKTSLEIWKTLAKADDAELEEFLRKRGKL
jgi:hypothetical protein